MSKIALLAAVVIGSASLVGSVGAAPYKQGNTSTAASPVRVAAGEKKEVEGTKADVKEDKAEAKATIHHKIKHRGVHKAGTTRP
jgi:hypothetical protein